MSVVNYMIELSTKSSTMRPIVVGNETVYFPELLLDATFNNKTLVSAGLTFEETEVTKECLIDILYCNIQNVTDNIASFIDKWISCDKESHPIVYNYYRQILLQHYKKLFNSSEWYNVTRIIRINYVLNRTDNEKYNKMHDEKSYTVAGGNGYIEFYAQYVRVFAPQVPKAVHIADFKFHMIRSSKHHLLVNFINDTFRDTFKVVIPNNVYNFPEELYKKLMGEDLIFDLSAETLDYIEEYILDGRP